MTRNLLLVRARGSPEMVMDWIYERLTVSVLPRLKVSIRIVAHSLRVRFNTRYLLIGFDWIGWDDYDPVF